MAIKDEPEILRLTDGEPSEYEQIMAVFNYWCRIRGDRQMPARADFDPADLAGQLPLISMLDVIDGGADYRFRLVGTIVEHMIMTTPTGQLLSDFPYKESAEAAAELYDTVIANQCPAFRAGHMHHPEQGHQRYAFLALPLSPDEKAINIILTVSEFPDLA